MNDILRKHNDDLFRLVAEDYCNEQTEILEKQALNYASDPLYSITEEDINKFDILRKKNNNHRKILLTWQKVAILFIALVLPLTIVSFSVSAVRNAINCFFINLSTGFADVSGNDQFNGLYSPVNAPEGYKVDNIENDSDPKVITYTDNKNFVYYREYSDKTKIDYTKSGTEIIVNGCKCILYDKAIVLQETDAVCEITTTDDDFDLLSFAKTIIAVNE